MNVEKEKQAIEYLKLFEPHTEPYYLCYSGGKDSDTIRILADLAGVNYECHNNHTTVDAPETVYYIRKVMSQYGEMHREHDPSDNHIIYQYGKKGFIHMPLENMWDLIARKKMPPTRLARYCCAELKEKGGFGRKKITGVRWAESRNRKNNQGLVTVIGKTSDVEQTMEKHNANFRLTNKGGVVLNTDNAETRQAVEDCYRSNSTLINPIVDWTDDEVWEFLHHYGCESNPLYQQGFKRIGCVGCPLGGSKHQKQAFARYPKYRELYVRAFDRMLEVRKQAGKDNSTGSWTSGEAVMRWWVGDNPNQITLEDYFGDDFISKEDVAAESAMP